MLSRSLAKLRQILPSPSILPSLVAFALHSSSIGSLITLYPQRFREALEQESLWAFARNIGGLLRYQVHTNWLAYCEVEFTQLKLGRRNMQHFGMSPLDVILELLHFSKLNWTCEWLHSLSATLYCPKTKQRPV